MIASPRHTRRTVRIACVLSVVWVVVALPALAQREPDSTALPDLAPHEYEIRGQMEIVLPTLARPDIGGFGAPLPVLPLPANRRAFTEAYRQSLAELPASPYSRPSPPEVNDLASRAPAGGAAQVGGGRYFSRFAALAAATPISERESAHIRLRYDGSAGHEPFPDRKGDFDELDLQGGLQTSRADFSAGLDLTGRFDRYALFGAMSPGTEVATPSRNSRLAGLSAWIETGKAKRLSFQARLSGTTSSHSIDLDDPAQSGAHGQSGVALSSRVLGSTPAGEIEIDVKGTAAALSPGRGADGGLSTLSTGATYRFLYRRAYQVTLGGRLMTFRTDGWTLPDQQEASGTWLAPEARVELYPRTGMRLYGQIVPGMDVHTLADLSRVNPYLLARPALRPTVRTLDAEGGTDVIVGPVRLVARAGLTQSPSFLYFERASGAESTGFTGSISTTRYDEARILYVAADGAVSLPGGFHATAGATVRNGRLTEKDTIIPYYGPLLGRASVSWAFAQHRGLVQLIGEYESARYRDTEKSRKIGDVFDLDISASWQILQSIHAIARIDNISAGYLERWDRYPGAPTVVMLGIKLEW